MLKIVPDPPLHGKDANPSLEDILIQTSEYLACAQTLAQQAVAVHPKSPGQVLTLATMHEIDSAHRLVEMALSRVQLRH